MGWFRVGSAQAEARTGSVDDETTSMLNRNVPSHGLRKRRTDWRCKGAALTAVVFMRVAHNERYAASTVRRRAQASISASRYQSRREAPENRHSDEMRVRGVCFTAPCRRLEIGGGTGIQVR